MSSFLKFTSHNSTVYFYFSLQTISGFWLILLQVLASSLLFKSHRFFSCTYSMSLLHILNLLKFYINLIWVHDFHSSHRTSSVFVNCFIFPVCFNFWVWFTSTLHQIFNHSYLRHLFLLLTLNHINFHIDVIYITISYYLFLAYWLKKDFQFV